MVPKVRYNNSSKAESYTFPEFPNLEPKLRAGSKENKNPAAQCIRHHGLLDDKECTTECKTLRPFCAAKFDIEMSTCNTCCCKEGQGATKVTSNLILEANKVCQLWFTIAVDPVVRVFVQMLIAGKLESRLAQTCFLKQGKAKVKGMECGKPSNHTFHQPQPKLGEGRGFRWQQGSAAWQCSHHNANKGSSCKTAQTFGK